MNRTLLVSLPLVVAAFVTGCQVSLWAGNVEDPYELNLPSYAEPTPTPVATPAP